MNDHNNSQTFKALNEPWENEMAKSKEEIIKMIIEFCDNKFYGYEIRENPIS